MASTTRRRFVDTLKRAAIYGRGLKRSLEAVRYAGPFVIIMAALRSIIHLSPLWGFSEPTQA